MRGRKADDLALGPGAVVVAAGSFDEGTVAAITRDHHRDVWVFEILSMTYVVLKGYLYEKTVLFLFY